MYLDVYCHQVTNPLLSKLEDLLALAPVELIRLEPGAKAPAIFRRSKAF